MEIKRTDNGEIYLSLCAKWSPQCEDAKYSREQIAEVLNKHGIDKISHGACRNCLRQVFDSKEG